MSSLILKTTSAHYGGDWSDDDYVVLGDGEVKKAIRVVAHKFSKSARAKIEAAGGRCEETA